MTHYIPVSSRFAIIFCSNHFVHRIGFGSNVDLINLLIFSWSHNTISPTMNELTFYTNDYYPNIPCFEFRIANSCSMLIHCHLMIYCWFFAYSLEWLHRRLYQSVQLDQNYNHIRAILFHNHPQHCSRLWWIMDIWCWKLIGTTTNSKCWFCCCKISGNINCCCWCCRCYCFLWSNVCWWLSLTFKVQVFHALSIC